MQNTYIMTGWSVKVQDKGVPGPSVSVQAAREEGEDAIRETVVTFSPQSCSQNWIFSLCETHQVCRLVSVPWGSGRGNLQIDRGDHFTIWLQDLWPSEVIGTLNNKGGFHYRTVWHGHISVEFLLDNFRWIDNEMDFRGRHSLVLNQHHRRCHGFS